MGLLTYAYSDFTAYTRIKSGEVNSKFQSIKDLVNGNIENSNISGAAAIARSKIATGSNNEVVINSGGGLLTSEANLAISRGGTGAGTKAAGYDALSPTTTKGDIAVRSSSTNDRLPVGTFGQVLAVDSSQALGVKWATPVQGSKNYLTTNNDFESAVTTGWGLGTVTVDSTTKFPNGVPTFGSGASANLSIAASAVPLGGTYSMNYTSSAISVQGNFVASDAFTLDAEAQGYVLGFKFAYQASSGASALTFSGTTTSSFGVAFYDVTNSAWIQPAGCFNFVTTGVGFATGTVQVPITCASMRLVVYNANASTGLFTLKLDDFSVGPQVTVSGPAVSDWQTYTPTGSWTTNTTYTGRWRRVGDSMQVQANLTLSGAPTAAGLTDINLPTGYVIDTTKLPGGAVATVILGSGNARIVNDYPVIVRYRSTTSVTPLSFDYSGDGAGTDVVTKTMTNSVPATWANGNTLDIEFQVPIVGWSSQSVFSSDTDTRTVSARYTTDAGQSIANNTVTVIDFEDKVKDSHGAVTTGAAWKYTVPVVGDYDVRACVRLASGGGWSVGEDLVVFIYKNSAEYSRFLHSMEATHTNAVSISISDLVTGCVAGDTIDIRVQQVSGAAIALTTGAAVYNYVSINRLSGPATIAATEKVYLQYTGNAGTALTADTTNIDFTTKVVDSHNAWSGTVFTAPRPGMYVISGSAQYTAAGTQGVFVFISGTKKYITSLGVSSALKSCAAEVYLNAQDTLSFRSDNAGTLLNSATVHWISISSQGGI